MTSEGTKDSFLTIQREFPHVAELIREVGSIDGLLVVAADATRAAEDRLEALGAYGRFAPDADAIGPLSTIALDRTALSGLRDVAIEALALLDGMEARVLPLLVTLAARQDDDSGVREAAAHFLRLLPGDDMVDCLSEIATNRALAASLRGVAVESLAEAGGRVAVVVMPLLDDPEPVVARWAAFTLGAVGGRDALPRLANARRNAATKPSMSELVNEIDDAVAAIRSRLAEL